MGDLHGATLSGMVRPCLIAGLTSTVPRVLRPRASRDAERTGRTRPAWTILCAPETAPGGMTGTVCYAVHTVEGWLMNSGCTRIA